ncbi:MAG: helix-turn-helix transcriptional regulator [Rhodobacteraceae bacterium]|nr:helix-turn-helix transcriptional regulator [Paracoccaceae bacterium]
MSELIKRVGERVRKVRESKGIPRRVLSEMSGVSLRYLAQLESGEGNISIGLLERVAAALNQKTEWFVGEEDPWTSEATHIAQLYRCADEEVQNSVMRLLNPELAGSKRAQRVCLLGLRGAGKSTLGRLAGGALDVPFVELNKDIEKLSGMPSGEVMALYGQEGYRKFEAQALELVIETHDKVVLAVAGGLVGVQTTYNMLLSRFHTVWLRASPEEHMKRVRAQGDERPMTGNPEAMEQLKTILASREAVYDRALARLDTSAKTEKQSLDELLSLLKERQFIS